MDMLLPAHQPLRADSPFSESFLTRQRPFFGIVLKPLFALLSPVQCASIRVPKRSAVKCRLAMPSPRFRVRVMIVVPALASRLRFFRPLALLRVFHMAVAKDYVGPAAVDVTDHR